MPEIQVDWHSQEEAERLRDLRDRHGMVWRGVLLEGAKHVESIDLLKALLELHPGLANPLPLQHGAANPKRTVVIEQLREQILERQHARSTTTLPSSAFSDDQPDLEADTEAESRSEFDGDAGPGDSSTEEHIDVRTAVTQMQRARAARTSAVQRSVATDTTRAREYEHWNINRTRAADDGEHLHPLGAHDDVEDALLHLDGDEREDVVDPRYDYDDYAYEGEY